MKKDMATADIRQNGQYSDALSRREWKEAYEQGLGTYLQPTTTTSLKKVCLRCCGTCLCSTVTLSSPISVYCLAAPTSEPSAISFTAYSAFLFSHWFTSHICDMLYHFLFEITFPTQYTALLSLQTAEHIYRTEPISEGGRVRCDEGERTFSRASDIKRHIVKCLSERSKPISEQTGP